MSYLADLFPPANARSWDYPDFIYGQMSGTQMLRYTTDDLYTSSCPATLGTNILSSPVVLDARFLGVHTQTANAQKISNGLTRSHDMAPRWNQMHTANGVFVDAGMGAWLDAQKAAGNQVIYTLFGTPTWASARPTEAGDPYNTLGAIAEPSNMSHLSAFVSWLMTTYGDRIDYLEVWNEPKYMVGSSSYFSGTPAKIAEMAKTINQAAKAVKPSITIMGVGATGIDQNGASGLGAGYTQSFLTATDGGSGFGRDWIDVLSVHTYVHDNLNTITRVANMQTHLAEVQAAAGTAFDIWSTEFGYITPAFSLYTGPVESKVRAIVRYALYHAVYGFKRAILYAYGSAMGWGDDAAGDAEWLRWASLLNGATVSYVNRLGASGQLACVINGENYLV